GGPRCFGSRFCRLSLATSRRLWAIGGRRVSDFPTRDTSKVHDIRKPALEFKQKDACGSYVQSSCRVLPLRGRSTVPLSLVRQCILYRRLLSTERLNFANLVRPIRRGMRDTSVTHETTVIAHSHSIVPGGFEVTS